MKRRMSRRPPADSAPAPAVGLERAHRDLQRRHRDLQRAHRDLQRAHRDLQRAHRDCSGRTGPGRLGVRLESGACGASCASSVEP